MTPEKIIEVLERLRKAVLDDYAGMKFDGTPLLPKRLDETGRKAIFDRVRDGMMSPERAQFEHLLFILHDALDLLAANRIEKCHRHLGWVQGALWCMGLVSIDELMQMNRPDERKVE